MQEKYIFSLPVWGNLYIENFLNISLPSQLAKNNIPYLLSKKCNIEYYIYTKEKEKKYFENNNAILSLKKMAKVKFIYLDDTIEGDKYHAMTYAHSDTLINRAKIGDYIVFTVSDAIYSNAFFKYAFDELKNNKKIMYMLGFRANPKLAEICLSSFKKKDFSISIDSAELTRIAIENIHLSSESHLINKKFFTHWNSVLIDTCGDGYIMKGFHLHPIVTKCTKENKTLKLNDSIDGGNFDMLNGVSDIEIGYINNSSKASMYTFELNKKRTLSVKNDREFNIFALADWMKNHSNKNHRKLVEKNYYLNIKNIDFCQKKINNFSRIIKSAKFLFENNLFFDDLIDTQYDYIKNNNKEITKKIITKYIKNIKKYLLLSEKKEKLEKLEKLEILNHKLNNIDDFFYLISEIINILNVLGEGKGYFSIFSKEEYELLLEKLALVPDNSVLYGAGDFGRLVYAILAKHLKKNVQYIIDDNSSVDSLDGCKIVKLQDTQIIKKKKYNIVLCTLNKDVKEEMIENIKKSFIDYEIF